MEELTIEILQSCMAKATCWKRTHPKKNCISTTL